MKKLIIAPHPTFNHWLRQRYILIIIFTSLMMVDVVVSYLYLIIFQTAQEQNPFLKSLLETPFGFAILTLLKLLLVLLVAGTSYHAYRELHTDETHEKAKRAIKQSLILERVMWWLVVLMMSVFNIWLLIGVNRAA